MMNTLQSIRRFLNYRFNLQEDRADEQVISREIRKNVDFKGANLWALIFAIFIASIGLNVNSTAVIIGAMLISPIMGPVMGIGLGIGINDLDLVKKGLKNLFVASVIGILASTAYFLITPLHDAQSELLARTSPSIWDVFIACFGGMAGMVAATRKEKSNVIPGVAIATALMPPLCTAGFGIAMGNWYFFLGAIYLYFINSVFIAIAAFVITRYVKLKRHHFEDIATEKRVNRYIIAIVIITLLPSIFMAYRIVDKSIFETNARKFVAEQFNFNNTQVVSKSFAYSAKQRSIEVLLIGAELDKHVLDTLNKKLTRYGLKGVGLHVRQGLNAQQHIDLSQIKASILEDVFNQVPKEDTVRTVALNVSLQDSTVLKEMKVLYPQIRSYGLSKVVLQRADSLKADTQRIALIRFQKRPSVSEIKTMQEWLHVRYKQGDIKVIIE